MPSDETMAIAIAVSEAAAVANNDAVDVCIGLIKKWFSWRDCVETEYCVAEMQALKIPMGDGLSDSRYKTGGLEERFIIERADGKPIPADRRYSLVLDFSGADPHAIVAARAYAESVKAENPQLSADILAAIANPATAPAQHHYTR